MEYYSDSMRHLVCKPYSIENLHKMAEDLNIKRCWFHKNHYDIPKRRIGEIAAKTKVVSPKEIWTIINGRVVELVDTADSKSAAERHGGSTPSTATKSDIMEIIFVNKPYQESIEINGVVRKWVVKAEMLKANQTFQNWFKEKCEYWERHPLYSGIKGIYVYDLVPMAFSSEESGIMVRYDVFWCL